MPTADNVNPAALAMITSALAGRRADKGPPRAAATRELIKVYNAVASDLTTKELTYLPLIMANFAAQLLELVEEHSGAPAEDVLQQVAITIAKRDVE